MAERMPVVAVGTCGFSYKDWIGPVYAPRTKATEMLGAYARRFATVEIDATYYRVPGMATFDAMARRTPDGFRFAVKLPSAGTHVPDPGVSVVHDDVALLRRNIEPLIDAGKFSCVLAQFPNAFRPNEATRGYLAALREELDDVALVAEFRHREWQTGETLELLASLGIGFVNVDQPRFDTLLHASADVTSDVAYVRFHGRNAANWWRGTNETRYDYLYEPAELEPWVERIVDMAASSTAREILVYFNNHLRGNAVRNAEMLEEMLASRLPDDALSRPPAGSAAAAPPAALELPLFDP